MVAILFKAGDHVPDIPLLDVVGNGVNAPPLQIGATGVNVGVGLGFTVIVRVCVGEHNPAVGVNVYVVVAVLFSAGDHVPVTPFVEVVGNGDNGLPEQIGATALNVGVTFGFTVIVN